MDVEVGAQRRRHRSGFSKQDLQRRRAERAVAGGQQALADVGAENRIPRRPQVDRDSEARNRLPARRGPDRRGPRPGRRTDRAGTARRCSTNTSRAPSPARRSGRPTPARRESACRRTCRTDTCEKRSRSRPPNHAAFKWIFWNAVEVEIARQAGGVLRVGPRRGRRRRRFAGLAQPPWLPDAAAEPGAVQQQAVAAAPILPRAAEPLGHRARRHVEGLGGRAVSDVAVEPELILERRFLERRRLPAEVEAGRQRPRSARARASLSPAGPYSRSLDGAAIAKKSTLASRWVVPIFDRWMLPAASTPANSIASCWLGDPNWKFEIVDAEDRQRKRVRRIERRRPSPSPSHDWSAVR